MVSSSCMETFPDSRDLNFPTEIIHMIPGISWPEGPVSCKYLGVPILWQCGWSVLMDLANLHHHLRHPPLHTRPVEHSGALPLGLSQAQDIMERENILKNLIRFFFFERRQLCAYCMMCSVQRLIHKGTTPSHILRNQNFRDKDSLGV